MKKLLNIFILPLFIVLFTFCEKGDDADDALRVLKSEVNFDANGGVGIIEISKQDENIEVVSDVAWCIPNLSGRVITVTVLVNEELSSRTAMIKILSEGKATEVAVTQGGALFDMPKMDYLYFLPEGNAIRIPFSSILPLSVEIENNWLKHEIADNEIVFTADPLNNDIPRMNSIVFRAGLKKIVVPVSQNSYSSLAGMWKLRYTDIDGNPSESNVKLESYIEGQSYIMSGLPHGAKCLLHYNSDNGHLVVKSGQYLGMMDSYYLYLCASDPEAGQFTTSSSAQYEGGVDVEGGDKKFTLRFKDNNTWSGFIVQEMSYTVFSAKSPNGMYLGDYERLTNMVMVKQ